jgi:hypothetical protein
VSHDNQSATATFYAETERLRGEIMHSPVAHTVRTLAARALGEKDAEIARLRAQLPPLGLLGQERAGSDPPEYQPDEEPPDSAPVAEPEGSR